MRWPTGSCICPARGFAFCLAWVLSGYSCGRGRTNKRQRRLCLGLALVFTVLSAQSYRQTQVWENDTTLWAAVIRKGATDRLAYFARGKMYDEKGDQVNAVADYTMAVTLDPKFPGPTTTAGSSTESREIIPGPSRILTGRWRCIPHSRRRTTTGGLIYFYLLEDHLALEDFNKAIELRPRVVSSYVNRARLFGVTGQYRLAAEDFTPRLTARAGQRRDRRGARRNLPRARRQENSIAPSEVGGKLKPNQHPYR